MKEPNPALAAKITGIGIPIFLVIGIITGLVVNDGNLIDALLFPPVVASLVALLVLPLTFWAMANKQNHRRTR